MFNTTVSLVNDITREAYFSTIYCQTKFQEPVLSLV